MRSRRFLRAVAFLLLWVQLVMFGTIHYVDLRDAVAAIGLPSHFALPVFMAAVIVTTGVLGFVAFRKPRRAR